MASIVSFFDNHKRFLFWIMQFLFWMVNFMFDLLVNPAIRESFANFMEALSIIIYAFFITLLLRFIYKKFKIHSLSPLLIILNLIIFSLAAGLLLAIIHHSISGLLKNEFSLYIYHFYENIWINLSMTVYPFLAWNSLYLGFKVYEQYTFQKQNAEKALILAQSAQLEMLRYQLNPHFLFNTLSSLRALIRNKENDIAETVVTKIAEFLKYSLLEGQESKVLLHREIKTINHYFDIEKVRFKKQLEIEYNIDSKSENELIPIFLIHSLIENAVKHGMKTSPTPLKISISTKITENLLFIEVTNTGTWIERSKSDDSTGTGLQNTRKRLELAYPNKHTFEIVKNEEYVKVKIVINTK